MESIRSIAENPVSTNCRGYSRDTGLMESPFTSSDFSGKYGRPSSGTPAPEKVRPNASSETGNRNTSPEKLAVVNNVSSPLVELNSWATAIEPTVSRTLAVRTVPSASSKVRISSAIGALMFSKKTSGPLMFFSVW